MAVDGPQGIKRVLAYSAGKDSTALVLWAKEQFPPEEIIIIFDDTIWEHEWTYGHLERYKNVLIPGARFERLTSTQYPGGMEDLVRIKGRVPSPKARFCTSELKVKPTIEFLKTLDCDYELYDGKRAQESVSRSKLPMREWVDDYDCYVNHPLLYWTSEQCFDIARKYGVEPNPLYLRGAGRVGCFPCVLINQRELKAYLSDSELGPQIKEKILKLEQITGRSFFPPNYIPKRFQTGFDEKSGKRFAWATDVFRYIERVHENQLPLLQARSCMSVYNLCER